MSLGFKRLSSKTGFICNVHISSKYLHSPHEARSEMQLGKRNVTKLTTNDRLNFQSNTTACSIRAINNFRCPFGPTSHDCTGVKANSKHPFPLSAVALANHCYSYHHSSHCVLCYVQCGRDTSYRYRYSYRYTDGQNITKYNYYNRNNKVIIKIRRKGKIFLKILDVINIKRNLWQQTWENLQQKWTHKNRRSLS